MSVRLKAFGLHFFSSVFIISMFLGIVFYIWFPGPFAEIYNTWDAIKIIVAVDVILGPLCTLIVFDIKKKAKELKLDMLAIITLQLIALGWGVHVTYSVRPVFIVFHQGDFFAFAQSDLRISALKDKSLTPAIWKAPRMVYVEPPKDADEYKDIILNQLGGDVHTVHYLTARYLPIENMEREDILKQAIKLDDKYKNPNIKTYVNNFINEHGRVAADYAFFPVKGGSSNGTLVLLRSTGDIAGYINENLEY